MAEKYIITHDVGTSSTKSILTTIYGEIIKITQTTYPIHHPKPGYAEQDPENWWQAVCWCTKNLLETSQVAPEDVAGMTFSSQMQSLVPVADDGTPVAPAMTWLDTRSAEILHKKLWTPPRIMGYNIYKLLHFLKITGGSPGHTGKDQIGKILWLQENCPEIYQKVYKFLDTKDYVVYKLTGNMIKSVDLAVIWWLLDTRKNRNQWHPKLCKMTGVNLAHLPEVQPSAAVGGTVTPEAAKLTGLLPGTPIINGAGDLSAAALGSGAIDEGELHIRIGTSGGVAGHFAERRIDLAHYTGCIGSTNPDKYYLGIAAQETAGVCLEWIRKNVLYHQSQLMEEHSVSRIYQVLDKLVAKVAPGADGLIFTPWMYGERCPLDDFSVRAGLYNLGLNHSRDHIVRAVFEGIAFNTRWALETLEKLYNPVSELNIVGGGASSNVWCQIFADVTHRQINQVEAPQLAAARGVALLASMTLGYIDSFEDIKKYIKIENRYQPNPENCQLYDQLFGEFKNIYKQNKKFYRRMNR